MFSLENLTYYFFPFENGEFEGECNKSLNNGWAYIQKNRDRWVKNPALIGIDQCHEKGVDFIVYNNMCYFFDRCYTVMGSNENGSDSFVVIIGKPSKNSADIIRE